MFYTFSQNFSTIGGLFQIWRHFPRRASNIENRKSAFFSIFLIQNGEKRCSKWKYHIFMKNDPMGLKFCHMVEKVEYFDKKIFFSKNGVFCATRGAKFFFFWKFFFFFFFLAGRKKKLNILENYFFSKNGVFCASRGAKFFFFAIFYFFFIFARRHHKMAFFDKKNCVKIFNFLNHVTKF